ncbi:MAG: DUF1330 domain-containing protein [Ruminococcus sp.]
MSCYFIVDTYIDTNGNQSEYEEYIELVKPIVESYGGEYLVRSNKVSALSDKRNPQRVIIIRFPSREELEKCFASAEYQEIMSKREENVDSRALIVEQD